MNYYKIQWVSYDEIYEYYFSHSEKKSEADFNSDVQKLLCKYGEEYIKQEKGWVGASSWIEYIVGKMNKLGYERLVAHGTFAFGGGSILDDKIEEDAEAWGEIVGKKLLEKAIKKNIKTRLSL